MKILFIFAIISLSLPVSNVYAWEPPLECADENREIQGNRTSPCMLISPDLTKIEYKVEFDYPNCFEELVFHMPGISEPVPVKRNSYRKVDDIYAFNSNKESWNNDSEYSYLLTNWNDLQRVKYKIKDGVILIPGETFTFNSRVMSGSKLNNSWDIQRLYTGLEFRIIKEERSGGRNYYVSRSNAVLRPGTGSKLSLVNSCLALLVQEKHDQEHAEQLRQEEAAKKAELLAQREAELKAEEQAKREAEQQARIAKLELQTILENKITVADTELIKTQTLAAQLEHEKTIGKLLNEITRIRLAGEEDRARLTNEYLVAVESSTSAFEGETGEIENRIQEYIDFNEKLFTSIAEYQASIESRVDDVKASVDEQLQQIEQLQQEAKDLAKEIEEIDQTDGTGVSGVDDSS